jgi:hypothetical protein
MQNYRAYTKEACVPNSGTCGFGSLLVEFQGTTTSYFVRNLLVSVLFSMKLLRGNLDLFIRVHTFVKKTLFRESVPWLNLIWSRFLCHCVNPFTHISVYY